MERVSVSDYAHIGNKNITGRPTTALVDRGPSSVTLTVWPIPDTDDYKISYFSLVGSDGISSGIGTTASVPPRFVPALIAGLAFHVAMKRPEVSARVPALKEEYEYQYRMAAESDRDKFSTFFLPEVYD